MFKGMMTFRQWCEDYGYEDCAVWISPNYVALCYDTMVLVERRADHQTLHPEAEFIEDELEAIGKIIGDELGECYDH